jgi:hypothetical protein
MSGLRSRRKGLRVQYLARDVLIASGISARKVSRAYQPGQQINQFGLRSCIVSLKTTTPPPEGEWREWKEIYNFLEKKCVSKKHTLFIT